MKSIKKRFAGEYKARERAVCRNRAEWAEQVLTQGVSSPSLAAFLGEMAKAERRDLAAIGYRVYLGGKLPQAMFGASNAYEALRSAFGGDGDGIQLRDIRLPRAIHYSEKSEYWNIVVDLLFEYLFAGTGVRIADSVYIEGPYELDAGVRLEQGDVVIDAGANIGMFSALASVRGCTVYSFEPVKYFVDNYLGKTAAWNKGITICPYALHDSDATISFNLGVNTVGPSRSLADGWYAFRRRILRRKASQEARAVKLDSFVAENGLSRVDFIKADIEGAERNMLAGAKETIRRFSPKLSICTYHLPDDPEVLGRMLREFQPKYTIVEKYKKIYAWVEKG